MRVPKELLKMREEAEEAARSARPSAPTLKAFVMQNAGLIESIRRARYQADPSDVWGWIARELVARGLVSGEVKAETLKTYCKLARSSLEKTPTDNSTMSAHARNKAEAPEAGVGSRTPTPDAGAGEAGGGHPIQGLPRLPPLRRKGRGEGGNGGADEDIVSLLDPARWNAGLTPVERQDEENG